MSDSAYRPVGEEKGLDSFALRALKRPAHTSHEGHDLSSRDEGSSPHVHDNDTDLIYKDGRHGGSAVPRGVRTLSSGSVISQAIVDFALILPALYFLAFGFIVYSRNATTVTPGLGGQNDALLEAAALGPTIFPIAFAAVVGRFLRSAAAWRVERQGARVATLEQLLGSKTVLSALTLPFQLRFFNLLTVPLVVLWALSPIGGQASRRVISVGPYMNYGYANVSYLDTNSQFYMGGMYSGSSNESDWPTYTAAYVASLVAPSSIKHGTQDTFAHFKVPMIEYLDGIADGDGFVPVTGIATWSSLLGIPILITNGSYANTSYFGPNSTFNIESSYWKLDCSELTMQDYDGYEQEGFTDFSKSPYKNVRTEKDGHGIHLGLEAHSRNSTTPRIIYWESLDANGITHTKCGLTTTYVESRVNCTSDTGISACAVTAIRRSLNPFTAPHLSMLDYTPGFIEDWQFFVNWLWGTPTSRTSTWSNPNDIYFTNPTTPMMPPDRNIGEWSPDIAESISVDTFNTRFSQLLNTAWLAAVAPGGVTGNYEATQPLIPPWVEGVGRVLPESGALYNSKSTTATLADEQTVIYCHRGWLAVLVVSSLAMLLAGIAGMVLEMLRRGPDMLGSFSSMLRDNRYFDAGASSSMLDGSQLAKEWAGERVRLGDVAAGRDVGHVALGAAAGEGCAHRVATGRLYG